MTSQKAFLTQPISFCDKRISSCLIRYCSLFMLSVVISAVHWRKWPGYQVVFKWRHHWNEYWGEQRIDGQLKEFQNEKGVKERQVFSR